MSYSFTASLTESGEKITIVVNTEPLCCPRCKSGEVANPDSPVDAWVFNIRAFRVDDWSECIVCKRAGVRACWFNRAGEFSE